MSRTSKDHPSRDLAVDIISSIDNDSMQDMVLLSNDGGEVPASRFVLGARSPVLRQMLFHNSTNGTNTSSQLKITYSTTVVRALVYYCRTNELDDIRLPTNEESLRQLVKLSQCAIELELLGLESLVGNLVASVCQVDPHLACTFFDEAASGGGKPPIDSVQSIALGFIRRNPEAALLRKNQPRGQHFYGGITSLQVESLKQVLKDSDICTEEINLFRAIVIWSEAPCKQEQRPKNMDAWAAQILIHNQREAAKPVVAECIDLSKIAPSDLLGVVTESGLVEETEVSNALIQIALRVETEGVHLSKRRSDDFNAIPQISYFGYEQVPEWIPWPTFSETLRSIIKMHLPLRILPSNKVTRENQTGNSQSPLLLQESQSRHFEHPSDSCRPCCHPRVKRRRMWRPPLRKRLLPSVLRRRQREKGVVEQRLLFAKRIPLEQGFLKQSACICGTR